MRRLMLLLLLLAIGAVVPPAAHAAPVLCPTPMPLADVKAALDATGPFEATGKTVSHGNAIDQFPVTVLGVLKDGVAVGHDMIIVNVHDYPAMDDPQHGPHGIWAGMSGSPVYAADGKLIGSISFGLSFGPSTIGGVTPADDLEDVLNHAPAPSLARGVRASASLQQKMVATGAVNAPEAASRLEELPTPLGVTGLGARRLQPFVDRLPAHQRFIPYRAGGASLAAAPGDLSQIVDGGNFATAISYGDVTAAGVGTTTLVCDGKAVAFGHPMNFDGPTSLSVHNADAIVIQNDPAGVPFKLANIGGLVGTLDQDRTTGIRALLPDPIVFPTPVVVSSHITDDGGPAQQGETDVNRTTDAPTVSAFHLLGDVDSTIDRIGAGTMDLSWTVTGTAAGKPFTFTRANTFADPFDISFASPDELFGMLQTIVDNPFTAVKFNTVDMTANVVSQFKQFAITGLQRFQGGKWVPVSDTDTITLTPGQALRVRVTLQNFRNSTPVAPVELSFPIPADATGDGSLDITGGLGGGDDTGGGVVSDSSTAESKSLADLLTMLKDTPKNNDLTGAVTLFGGSDSPPPGALFADSTPKPVTKSLAEVVTGGLSIPVTIPSDEPPPPEPPTVALGGKPTGKLGTTLRKGLRLTVTSSAPGRLVARATVDKKTARRLHLKKNAKGPVVVASVVKNVGDGRTHVTLKFTKKAKKHLKHAKRVKLTVRAAITDIDGNTGVDSSKVVLTKKTH